jgi:uncharacterized protein (DUF983 family)
MWSRLRAIIRQRCPRCLEGRIFSGLLHSADSCSRCRLSFQREPGYYVGAAYFAYGLSVAQTAPVLVLLLWVEVPDTSALGLVLAELLLLSPLTFRYARVLWLHFDQVVGLSRN